MSEPRGRFGAICVWALLSLWISACGQTRQTQSHAAAKAISGGVSGSADLRPQSALLSLPSGRSSAQYRITAPSPARYDFDVALDLPTAAHITVQLHTWYGAVLDILDYKPGEQHETSAANGKDSCTVVGSRLRCLQHYPLLASEKAGPWTVVVSKRSEPAAVVHASVTFHRP